MKKPILLFLVFLAIAQYSMSQTTHEIEAGGGPGGPIPYYSPQFITIQVGDIVHWQSVGGTHNVDGRITTFPANPVTFFSGNPATGLNFSFTFTVPGFYEFECGAFDHADTQFGSITVVEGPNALTEVSAIDVSYGPNPAHDFLDLNSESALVSYEILDMKGQVILQGAWDTEELQTRIDLAILQKGFYLMNVQTRKGGSFIRFAKE